MTAEETAHGLLDGGVEMHGVEQPEVRAGLDQREKSAADALEAFAEGLAAMAGDEGPAGGGILREPPRETGRDAQARHDVAGRERTGAGQGGQQRVDDGVARDVDPVRRHALTAEVVCRVGGGAEMPAGEHRGHAPVHLLRPGRSHVARAEAGFDVAERHAAMGAGDRGAEHGRGVALHEHGVRPGGVDPGADARRDARREFGEGLSGAHEPQVRLRAESEGGERRREHLAVLAGGDQRRTQAAGGGERRVHGGELHRLGAGAQHEGDGPHRGAGSGWREPSIRTPSSSSSTSQPTAVTNTTSRPRAVSRRTHERTNAP